MIFFFLSPDTETLQCLLQTIEVEVQEWGLKLNLKKCELVRYGSAPHTEILTVSGQPISTRLPDGSPRFGCKYLGVYIPNRDVPNFLEQH